MTKYRFFLLGSFVLGVLLALVGDYYFYRDWEFWVLGAPYWILGSFTT